MTRLDPHSYADSTQPAATHLDLKLHVDFARKTLEGSAALTFASDASGPVDLDTRGLTIHDVVDAAGKPVRHELSAAEPILGSRLRVHLPSGTRQVTIRYTTSPDATALQWLDPAQTASRKHPYLFSQCQAIHARSMVPLQDSPRVRITYRAELTVPDPLTAVMAAAADGKSPGPTSGTTTFRFHMPQPIPSYLLALAVGEITSKDISPRSRVYAEPLLLDRAVAEFSDVESMIVAAEKLFGPYPWDRFDMLVMPPSFPYGGMENPRLTFLTPTLLAGDKSLVNVVVHELSHSWTGNLVTNASLEHFWLNEGFTVFAERRILEVLEGNEAVALHAAIGRSHLDEDVERLGQTSPHTALRTHLTGVDPDEVYSGVPYEKGCLFLRRIEDAAGRPAFDRFLAAYIQKFRFQSITTDDFLALLDTELPGVAEKVNAKHWIDGTGIPADAPTSPSKRLAELQGIADAWAMGQRPDAAKLRAFTSNDWQVLLPRLPKKLSVDDVACLDREFNLMTSNNAEILVAYLTHAARNAYAPAYPRIREVLTSVGRMKYLRPLYTALREHPETLKLGKEIFESAKSGYHPVARAVMAGVLEKN
ncbi:MAG: M1 family metallopeptidase [Myxococcota bacterium]